MTTVAMTPQPNKATRYLFDGSLAVPIEDDQPAAAEPSHPPDVAAAIAALKLVGGDLAKKRNAEYEATDAKAREVEARLKKAEADRKAADGYAAKTRAAADEYAANTRAMAERESQQRTRDLEGREQSLAKGEAALQRGRAELKADRAKFDRKVADVNARLAAE